MLSRKLTNPVFTNVAFGVGLNSATGVRPPQYSKPVFPLRLSKCEITQTVLDKREFAQKIA